LVALQRHAPITTEVTRQQVFAVVDAAFAQRRKTLRSTLAQWAGSREAVDALLETAGVDPSLRGEALDVAQFAAIAIARQRTMGS
jgi:16S rRNA (adenine1518-N6/adenine1519-N6)-dimethyltransferase